MDISGLYDIYKQHPAVATDSRACPPGSVFFALKGESFDGNEFAEAALRAGCAYAVIDNPAMETGGRTVLVENVLQALQQLAALHRRTLGLPVIGITGTNGKTTTKELVSAVLSKKYNVLCTQGNLNNHIGVPLTLLRLTEKHEIAVVEMGANHPGEISGLVQISQPDYGIITNVGYAHLEGFGSFEGVLRTKGELYDYLRGRGGKIFIDKGDKNLQGIASGLEQIPYAASPLGAGNGGALVCGQVESNSPFLRFQWRMKDDGRIHAVGTRLIGDYNLQNALAAVAVGCHFEVPSADIDDAIAEYTPSNNRSQWRKTAKNELVIDAYNANASSMKAALANFASLGGSPKAVILGDMLELGESSVALHAEIVKLLGALPIDKVLLCGSLFSSAGTAHQRFPDVGALRDFIAKNPLEGYQILIKGSHGMHLEKIIDLL